jgi:2-C-methyl-D-erythritol 4-phosphate cytidylyltransferase/2-C-methyl-D-erythritol 2,4-cyclodiphosphate synthase
MPSVAVLIVAAGKGERAGLDAPKQYAPLAGKALLRWTAETFAGTGVLQIVIGADQEESCRTALGGLAHLAPVTGGATRQDSVRAGLEALAKDAPDFVLIHDAARPLVPRAVIARVVVALESGADAAIPMLALADTLRKREGDGWTLVARDGLYRAQTPQGFRFDAILKAHRDHAGAGLTDDMALAERAGLKIEMVEGDEKNIKVTRKEDFTMAEQLLAARGDVRVATGYDVHRFAPGDHVWLCGVKVPHDFSLEGHSDADAGLHALTDAILGCIGAGDIGQHFPPTDERWRGASSDKFLAHAAGLVAARGGMVSHVDVTLICERPKIGPHREAMAARVAEILGIEISRVSVKATTTEGLGFTGRREGLAAQAIATVRLP